MRLLLTNDDGISAPGILRLADMAIADGHEVYVYAPDRECSATSHAITVFEPLRARPYPIGNSRAFAINGKPADCVRLGLLSLVNQPVDLVISGINRGFNTGTNCVYSGTVGAAVEAAMLGCPALASSTGHKVSDYSAAARYTLKIALWTAENPPPNGVIYNLNVPNLPYDEIKGPRWAPLAGRLYATEGYELRTAPLKYDYYLIKDEPLIEYEPGSDAALSASGCATMTALTWDMTYYGDLPVLPD
jgi:5'-nucleotidase